ncbi:MAG TPA: hypothetical protein VM282_24500 [Acidimicrobiales bacterium]|nr:hypothetical protein [Acidimicrobiales bacterium]
MIETADGLTVCALLGSGARWDDWDWPQELAERPGNEVPPISREDVIWSVKRCGGCQRLPDNVGRARLFD